MGLVHAPVPFFSLKEFLPFDWRTNQAAPFGP